ncbi:MAG: hypothetical protein FWG32_03980 [Oscillospiraceae bacterium]|nr:hypothetical protein [Oscillospiraceae bacterium]
MKDKEKGISKERKGCLAVFLIIAAAIALIAAITIFNPFGSSGPVRRSGPSRQSGSVTQSLPSDQSDDRSDLANLLDLSEEQEAAVREIFSDCGIDDVTSIRLQSKDTEQSSYSVSTGSGTSVIVNVNNESKKVERIFTKDHDIYSDNRVRAKITDFN